MNYRTFQILDRENITNCFTFRPYNFSKKLEDISKRYQELLKDLHSNTILITPIQTHTDTVEIVTKENLLNPFQDVDGLITDIPGISLGIVVADCQGILFYDKKKKVIAAVHSGWRGTLKGIASKTVQMMMSHYHSRAEDILLCITPCIHKCCFEIQEDVVQLFLEKFDCKDLIVKKGNSFYMDTVELNKREMMKLGIPEENMEISDLCSKCHAKDIHSYRDNHQCGRNLAIIGMEEAHEN